MVVELPNEFFTRESMLTLTGAAGATFVIANGLQRAFSFNPRWLALGIAEALCAYGVYASGGAGGDYVTGVINGFLVYSTAAGVTAVTGTDAPEAQRGAETQRDAEAQRDAQVERRGFLTRWF